MDVEAQKRAAAARALEFVRPGMRLGLGTGSTAKHFVDLLGDRVRAGLEIVAVPTSEETRAQAERLGIALTTLDDTPELDLTVDGADEIAPDLTLIKGGGGALLREKIVAAASAHMVVIADEFEMGLLARPFPAADRNRAFRRHGDPPRRGGNKRRGGLSWAGAAAQREKRPSIRHRRRALAPGRPIATHRRPASAGGAAQRGSWRDGARSVHRPCADCYSCRSGRSPHRRAALSSAQKGEPSPHVRLRGRPFRYRGWLGRRACRAHGGAAWRARDACGGISRRRYLRHPRLRAEEASRLRLALSRRIRGRRGLWLDAAARVVRLADA